MAALGEYTNVYNTALNLLVRRGYQVWYMPESREYCAEKDGWDFRGMTPLALLGAVAVYDDLQPAAWKEYWWRYEPEELFDKLPTSPKPYTPVYKRPR